MDGNGRWAEQRGRPRTYGHIKGAKVAKNIIAAASDMGLKCVTLYAFSSENWSRPITEVSFLMKLLDRYLTKETQNLIKKNIKIRVIGDLSKVPDLVRENIASSMEKTKHCTGTEACFAIGYGSRQELMSAIKQIIHDGVAEEEITEDLISKYLFTKNMPDPDLVIRTSGEQRLSNFLMWQSSYAELLFTETLWPDFTVADFKQALMNFQNRKRRFGKIESQINERTN